MGLFEKVFGRPRNQAGGDGYFKTFTAYSPAFRTWGGELYESELVRAAVDARARHISKLQVEIQGAAQPKLQTKLKKQPNDFQTWGQMLYRSSTILDMQGTCFIVPVVDELGRVTGMFPVLPSLCEVVQHAGEAWLRYTFSNGQKAAIRMSECAVLTKYQYKDDLFGTNNSALIDTMKLMSVQSQAIGEAVKNSNSYRFMAQLSNFAKPEDLAKERKRFTSENLQGDGASGLLLFPNTYSNVQQIKAEPYVVDAAQLEIIKTNVFNYFGVNQKVLQNEAVGDAWSAFYEGAIEPFAIQFSDAVTRMFFSDGERANGSGIFLTANRLQYMSTQEKLNVSAQMADRGIMNRDEIRAIWNLPELPNGEGKAYIIRGEYKNAADQTKEGDGNDGNS